MNEAEDGASSHLAKKAMVLSETTAVFSHLVDE